VKRFEIEVEVVDRDMKTDDAVSSFLKSIYMTLVHVDVHGPCTQSEEGDDEVIRFDYG
jgi:hypothetical protein